MTRLSEAWARAVTAELCWIDPDGSPAAIAVTPVLLGSTVCAAVPYARAAEVAGLRSAGSAAFAVTDSRSLAGTDAVVAAGTVTVTDDVSGDLFTDELLEQELAKYPPSRTLADSVLLRRENWWWLPRIVVRLDASAHPSTLPARTNPARHALLVTPAEDGTAPAPRCVDLAVPETGLPDTHSDAGSGAPVPARDLSGERLPDGRAFALGYDYTIPDMERWETWSLTAAATRGTLATTSATGTPGADLAPLGLLARTRRHRALAKACRTALRTVERTTQPTS